MIVEVAQQDAPASTMLDALMEQMTQGVIIMNIRSDEVQINREAWALMGKASRTYETSISRELFYQLCEPFGQLWPQMNANDAKPFCEATTNECHSKRTDTPVVVDKMLGSTLCRIKTIVRPGVGLMWILTDISNSKVANASDRSPMASADIVKRSLDKIKVPMNGVMGMAGLLQRTDLSGNQAIYADGILDAGSALSSIVKNLADYSALEFGQVLLKPKPFDLTQTVANVVARHDQAALIKGISIGIDPCQGVSESVVGDASCVARILDILIGNAIRHTEVGGVTIEQKFRRGGTDLNPTSVVSLAVSDNGPGLRPSELKVISAQLNSEDYTNNDDTRGIGIRLGVVASLVRLMNGHVRIRSEEPYGTMITVEIELAIAA